MHPRVHFPIKAPPSRLILALIFASAEFLSGCAGRPGPSSSTKAVNQQVYEIGNNYRPEARKLSLPVLSANSPQADYLRFALLNHPSAEAAFYEWRANVEAITTASALPDPQLTFQADIGSTIMSLMPGVMFDLMTLGKRAAMGREATAGAEIAHRAYSATLVRIAVDTRKALIDLAYFDEALRLLNASVAAVEQTGELTASAYATGRGMSASLEAQVKIDSESARLRSEISRFEARRLEARARLKSALGLLPTDPDPVWPLLALQVTPLPPTEELWRRIQASNPELASMRAMIEMAVAGVDVAQRRGTPDFTLGLMADVKQKPWMWRPTATLSLPVWRGKIDALIATAQSRKNAAVARANSEELNIAAEMAQMLAMVRESDLMIDTIDSSALPNLVRTREIAVSGYSTGTASAVMITETDSMQLAMLVERAKALREREQAVVSLLAMTAEFAPSHP